MATKILLDTDIGSDIDDAVCLAYLLANPDCDLMGITTVSGEPIKRAQMASAMCKVAGKDIPIYPGAGESMLIRQRQHLCHQAAGLTNWEHDKEFPEAQAVNFMRDMIRSNPGEIVLLPIGPMTNIGLLFAMDPEIPSLLKGLVLMCGVFTNRLPEVGPLEWNAISDPHATAITYRYTAKTHRSIGLDVTKQVVLDAEDVKKRFQAELLKPVLDFAEIWFARRPFITFHDPLAATTIFDDGICKFEKGNVDVELKSDRLLGVTHWTPDPEGKHEVAMEVDKERFFEHFFSMFG